MRILVLQHIACEHPGIFRDLMDSDGVVWDAIELDDGDKIPEFDPYDAMIVMGGPMDVWQQDAHPWLIAEIDAIRRWVVDAGKPYLGFCLGHQLLALALGGKVAHSRQPEIGIMEVALTDSGKASPFFKDCPPKLPCLQWHSAEITALPESAQVLATSEACKVNAMSWGNCAFSVQFHIELTAQTVDEWAGIPEYANALEHALGPGALDEIRSCSDRMMPAFNELSGTIYRNFMAVAKEY